MATIEVLSFDENRIRPSAWGDHAKSELRKRLRRSVNASLAEIRRLAHQIDARKPVSLNNIRDEAVDGITQMLETVGAEIRVLLVGSNSARLFKRIPKR